MQRKYFSQRHGLAPHPNGLPLADVMELFLRLYSGMATEGYFTEAFGYECVDAGWIEGEIKDPDLDILLKIRKRNLARARTTGCATWLCAPTKRSHRPLKSEEKAA